MEQRKSVRSPLPEKEGEAETMCDELTTIPIPHPPVPLVGRRQRKSGVKLSLERREESGEGVFEIQFYVSLHYSDFDWQ